MRIQDRTLEAVDRVNNEQAELIEQTEGERFENDQFRTRQGSLDRVPGRSSNERSNADDELATMATSSQDRTSVLDVVRRVLAGDFNAPQRLHLGRDQKKAMELLIAAVRGKDPVSHTTVYAEDRRMMLEQSIAALQPVIGMGGMHMADDVKESQSLFAKVLGQVNELREKLEKLESTQEEFAHKVTAAKKTDGTDEEDDEDETDGADEVNNDSDQDVDGDDVDANTDDNEESQAKTAAAVNPSKGNK
jgi:hypothetical protein